MIKIFKKLQAVFESKQTIKSDVKSRSEVLLEQLLVQMKAIHNEQRFAGLGPQRIFEFPVADKMVRMYMPFANIDLIQKSILMNGNFFEQGILNTVKDMIPQKAVVIDAGANIGNHTVFFAHFCGAGRIYSFEPLIETYRILERNIALNCLANVTAINAALGARPGRAQLRSYSANNIGGSSLSVGNDGSYEVTTIDALGLDQLDFMKIDVEGHHVSALRGARETIARCRPLIWIELRRSRGEFEPGEATLKEMSYCLKRELSPIDYLFGPA